MELPEPIKDLQELEFTRHRRIWLPFMKKYNIQSVCELGVFASQNFKRFLHGDPAIAVGVDLWRADGHPARNDSSFTQEKQDEMCEYSKSLMKRYPAMRLYRDYTHYAVYNFPDEYFDLIYIDADHSYEGCKQDLDDWWPKLKKGKFFIGDDYSYSHAPVTGVKFGVIPAVNEFAKKNNVTVYELPSHGWAIIKPE
jgi:hypothetical protein